MKKYILEHKMRNAYDFALTFTLQSSTMTYVKGIRLGVPDSQLLELFRVTSIRTSGSFNSSNPHIRI